MHSKARSDQLSYSMMVLALPLQHKPLFPGFSMPIYVKDPKLLAALRESKKRQAPYAGAFLLKDEPRTNPSFVSGSEMEINMSDFGGKELYDRLHEVGTLAQISSIQGDQVVLIGHNRLRIAEMVSEEPLIVKVDHLKDKPYNKDDDYTKATSFEVISTPRNVLKTPSLWRDHARTYTQHWGDCYFPRLTDFWAAMYVANKLQCQDVLEELDYMGDFNFPRLANFWVAMCVANKLQCQDVLEESDDTLADFWAAMCVANKLQCQVVLEELDRRGDFNFSQLADFGAAMCVANKLQCQDVLEELNVYKRTELTLEILKKEMEIYQIQELGVEMDDKTNILEKFRQRHEQNKYKCPPRVAEYIEEEITKLQLLEVGSSEFYVTKNYVDWLTVVPWGVYSDDNFDILGAQKIFDEDHYGLIDLKQRILEFIAVGKLSGIPKGKIICLSGPPGVEKISIGRSIARVLNRKFFKLDVEGLDIVAEIKGHRRTYIPATPGKIVQGLKNVGTANPLILIDEIDKLGSVLHAGDFASAMLELLDPERNDNFLDHYLDVPFDLSKVLFVCTANDVEMIPSPLLDRMEVISIAG